MNPYGPFIQNAPCQSKNLLKSNSIRDGGHVRPPEEVLHTCLYQRKPGTEVRRAAPSITFGTDEQKMDGNGI